MKTYAAKIDGNFVAQIIVGNYIWANENLGGVWVDCTDNGELNIATGYTYNAETHNFIPPILEVPE